MTNPSIVLLVGLECEARRVGACTSTVQLDHRGTHRVAGLGSAVDYD